MILAGTPSVWKAEPRTVGPSLKTTSPAGTTVPLTCCTVAVRVTGSPLHAGSAEEVRVVVVGGSFGTVTRVNGRLPVPWMAAVPLNEKTRPLTLAPLPIVTVPCARMLPRKVQYVPSVAEPLICQKRLSA